MYKFTSESTFKPASLIIESRLIDVNEDVTEKIITEEYIDENGDIQTKDSVIYSYTTYRFRNNLEYVSWLNKRKDTTIAEQQDQIMLLEGCVMELTQIISDMIEVMEG